jgi:hypothetical protein
MAKSSGEQIWVWLDDPAYGSLQQIIYFVPLQHDELNESRVEAMSIITKCLLPLVPKNKGKLPVIPVDERAAEVRAIKAG